jgi:hypothetical protein
MAPAPLRVDDPRIDVAHGKITRVESAKLRNADLPTLMDGALPTSVGGVAPGFADQRNLELLVEAGFTAK